MAWIYLLLAGMFEIGWPLGLKFAQKDNFIMMLGFILAGASIIFSGFFLYLAQKEIPMGTAYAVWTAIGSAGTFAIGILFFGDATSLLRYLGVILIISGVIILKLAS
ncbi:MAG: multidrug efflux SMR transporter [Alphaproteobacteria bacterium]|jgi:quaternary ammonium compound-resistance protein SugE|nr:multidrug efflux SMR transporter [Alphaproteobacteria bacterium]